MLKLRRLACREAIPASRETTLARDYFATPLVATSAFEVRAILGEMRDLKRNLPT